jgi:lipopolysaccharide transport system ATP-binding protein
MSRALEVDQLGKRYRLGGQDRVYATMRESLMNLVRHRTARVAPHEWIWALRDASFTVEEGQVVGLIGRNGAGKSTLLKILSRITVPTEGEARLYGRVGSLLEVGTGFHPELTGRENIFLSGTILGMRRQEIVLKFDEIVDFSEIETFIDTPVKHYSSGMYVRLAFAVAAHLEPEILLIDEVLAVGDLAFQKKCLRKMSDIARGGRTVLFVSHNMPAVQNLCSRGILVRDGRIVHDGEITSAIESYTTGIYHTGDEPQVDLTAHRGRRPGRPIWLRAARLSSDNVMTNQIPAGAGLNVEIDVEADFSRRGMEAWVVIENEHTQRLLSLSTGFMCPGLLQSIHGRRARLTCAIPSLPLLPGTYYVSLFLSSDVELGDAIDGALAFEVTPHDIFGSGQIPPRGKGPVLAAGEWHVDEPPLEVTKEEQ